MKKIFTFLGVAAVAVTMNAQTVLTQWNFDNSSTAPSTGSGQIALIGGVTENIQSGNGACNCSFVGGNPSTGKAYTTTGYPSQNSSPGSAGIQFSVSTAGAGTVSASIDVYGSNTASKYFQVQYTTDGSSWINLTTTPSVLATSKWTTVAGNLPASAGNNGNFALRVVSVFDPANNASYTPIGTSSTYASTGALRFDNVTIYSSALATSEVTALKTNLVENSLVKNEISFGAKADVKILNMNGQVVKSASVEKGGTLMVSGLAKGTYIVVGEVNGEKVTQKIIKQ